MTGPGNAWNLELREVGLLSDGIMARKWAIDGKGGSPSTRAAIALWMERYGPPPTMH